MDESDFDKRLKFAHRTVQALLRAAIEDECYYEAGYLEIAEHALRRIHHSIDTEIDLIQEGMDARPATRA